MTFFAAFLLMASTADPSGSLTGAVIGVDGKPIAGVAISINGPSLSKPIEVVTQSDGVYVANNVAPGQYEIRADLAGFATASDVAEVVSSDTTERDYVLRPVGASEAITTTAQGDSRAVTAAVDMSAPAPAPQPSGGDLVSWLRQLAHRDWTPASSYEFTLGKDVSLAPTTPSPGTNYGAWELQTLAAKENASLTPEQREYAEREINRRDVRRNVDAAFKVNNIPLEPAAIREVRMAYLGAEESVLSSSGTKKRPLRDISPQVLAEYVKHRDTPRQHTMIEWFHVVLFKLNHDLANLVLKADPLSTAFQRVRLDEDTYGPGYEPFPKMNIYKVETGTRHDVTIDMGHHQCSFIVTIEQKDEQKELVCPHVKAH
jgi:hypothetical protein